MWQDGQLLMLMQVLSDWHGWLLVGWLVSSLLVIAVVGDGDS